jgi:hypothetical protein
MEGRLCLASMDVLTFERPFLPDADEPTEADDSNEPYLIFHEYLLSKTNAELPQVISTSYGDDEQVSTYQSIISRRVTNCIPDCPREVRQTRLQSHRPKHTTRIDYHPLFR